jgi:hypothetical protein
LLRVLANDLYRGVWVSIDAYRVRLDKVEKKAAAGDGSPKAGAGGGLSDFMSSFSAVRSALYARTTTI